MENLWVKIKGLAEKHPYLFGGGVFLVGAVLIYYFYSGSSSSSSANSANAANQNAEAAAIASGNALQAAQLQDQTQLGVANIQAGVADTSVNDQLSAVENQTAAAVTENQQNTALSATEAGDAVTENNQNTQAALYADTEALTTQYYENANADTLAYNSLTANIGQQEYDQTNSNATTVSVANIVAAASKG